MLIDLTLPLTHEMLTEALTTPNRALIGHVGTHFDVMNKDFPLTYTARKGVVFDVSGIADREIDVSDIDLQAVKKNMFVAFYTGYIDTVEYGSRSYYAAHPQLSHALIHALLAKGISIIGIDCAGVRRGPEHTPTDQYCADCGVFVVENLYHLRDVLQSGGIFTAHTYPLYCTDMTGLPCRVIADTL